MRLKLRINNLCCNKYRYNTNATLAVTVSMSCAVRWADLTAARLILNRGRLGKSCSSSEEGGGRGVVGSCAGSIGGTAAPYDQAGPLIFILVVAVKRFLNNNNPP